ncbi:LLM class flavin-dependent oxidoreductase [Nocardia cyriacigeorgica]|uniref:LLM class flavin-dependent oxidoreductase n=1 Tax=Nocardia cyriacigeorgica TaxID=135487 RepID=UPI001896271A|nr:LLM class flavin-dependent oxidoreductase [Nocardia cyriacigeorgica]MBF6440262.1 LLM class flavin-dependent oxidoreductase [Nocardia cyriacigeorgica]MBF6457068.1 LLM class flavin-dependent oxidoreductase [Nocardia cyriacigeorgica]MBF6476740.1 LLM class flavin-dependent oxidoreductase [Nocardia cyriacigeorgica]MBF6554271.1 LLM class flavin-dependent oxidoreductase [Nocardia cyriacigeorgica]
MTDYGRDLQFGVFVNPAVANLGNTLEVAELADESGLDFIAVQDHPYQARFLDAWALMSTLLARTQRVRVVPDVVNLPLRPPAVLAKSAASLDVLSGGRFELALGAGAFWEAIAAMGGAARSKAEAATALEEAVEVIRLMWSDQRAVRFDGHFYRLSGAHPGPRPAHPISIWLGVSGPRLLRLVGRRADGWIPSSTYIPPSALPERNAVIDQAAREAGRDPGSILRGYNVFGEIGSAESAQFSGPVDQWVRELTSLATEFGMDTFLFGHPADDVTQIRTFAEKVAPAVRSAVAARRAAG